MSYIPLEGLKMPGPGTHSPGKIKDSPYWSMRPRTSSECTYFPIIQYSPRPPSERCQAQAGMRVQRVLKKTESITQPSIHLPDRRCGTRSPLKDSISRLPTFLVPVLTNPATIYLLRDSTLSPKMCQQGKGRSCSRTETVSWTNSTEEPKVKMMSMQPLAPETTGSPQISATTTSWP